ncbi:Putative inner membrane protein [Salmonella enterica subsp. enterica serovar Gaminara str. A4-567]|nr:Putative inner membrane protein [Salmonella enterica subsp. enterica serovar Gaminara str. A4-567]
MNKIAELKRAKRLALSLLLIAAATFVTTLFLPPSFWVLGVKAIAEAAMVGALADWFAVVALFRRIPIPFISRHTAIIPRNKDRIGENLGQFVQEKFLDTQSLIALIRRHEPALLIGNWFSQPDNASRVGQHLLQIMSGFLELTDDARIQRLLKRAVHKAIDKVDLSGTSALMLESMTKNDRHQVLLDTLIAQLIALLQRDSSRTFIARQIIRWLETEHPLKAKILPTEWLGEHSAELVSDAVNSLLDDISHDRAHQIRHAFDRATYKLIDKLKHDPEMAARAENHDPEMAARAARAENIKSYLKEDEAFNRYLGEIWADLRQWLKTDINAEDSKVKQRIAHAGQWFGETLIADDALRASLNGHLEQAAHRVAPEFAAFLTRHISDTVKGWDARDMSQQIELNIGKDLQFIRVNGTLVGGAIGLVLYLLSQIPALLSI